MSTDSNNNNNNSTKLDKLNRATVFNHEPEVIQIIIDSIRDGLLRSERLRTFHKKLDLLKGQEREDYLQGLWDKIEHPDIKNKL